MRKLRDAATDEAEGGRAHGATGEGGDAHRLADQLRAPWGDRRDLGFRVDGEAGGRHRAEGDRLDFSEVRPREDDRRAAPHRACSGGQRRERGRRQHVGVEPEFASRMEGAGGTCRRAAVDQLRLPVGDGRRRQGAFQGADLVARMFGVEADQVAGPDRQIGGEGVGRRSPDRRLGRAGPGSRVGAASGGLQDPQPEGAAGVGAGHAPANHHPVDGRGHVCPRGGKGRARPGVGCAAEGGL